MNGIKFFGTPQYPGQAFSNRKFCRMLKTALLILIGLGIVFASLKGVGPNGLWQAGAAIAPLSCVMRLSVKVFNKNWYEKQFLFVLASNKVAVFRTLFEESRIRECKLNCIYAHTGGEDYLIYSPILNGALSLGI